MPKNLSYPLNVEGDDQQGHYIMFMINESTAGTLGTGKAAVATDGGGMGFTIQDCNAILNEIPGVLAVSPEVRASGQAIYGNKNWSATAYGVNSDYLQIKSWLITLQLSANYTIISIIYKIKHHTEKCLTEKLFISSISIF